ncbi:E3 ubiquitin-protein ligase arih2 [Saguinus oedipus]|uniref:E3 ubiquitin-protein ligase arih2 n=1 Tax=Saguinus oedipus TaxID=9490 RepID=A0ABQ9UBQ9_SAGOE|nr:E3 ubiquitin-protein ligase arih2 [Saguinus oedipus]
MNNMETWINQQYLQNAAKLLAKKKLFEYQQTSLEAEIKNLSWKVECVDSYDRDDMENQMRTAEQQRRSLLKDFHDT